MTSMLDPTVFTADVQAYDTTDNPTLTVMSQPVSRQKLLKRIKMAWGDSAHTTFRQLIDDVFKGFVYDRDYPRQLCLDYDNNVVWAFCYKRPKRQDPSGSSLVKTVIQLPPTLTLDTLGIEGDVPWPTLTEIHQTVSDQSDVLGSRTPLLGVGDFSQDFVRSGTAHQHVVSVGEANNEATYINLDLRWLLASGEAEVSDGEIAQQVSRRDFYYTLKGQYRISTDYLTLIERYLKALGVTPYYQMLRTDTQHNFALRYTLDVKLDDEHCWPVHGGLFLACRRRKDLQ